MPADSFRCFYVTKAPGEKRARGQVTQRPLAELPAGEVLIRVEYSALNYKDALSATGHPGVTQTFPHVPGIDAAGRVERSSSPMVHEGDEVFVTGFDMGQNTWGGLAEFIQVPGNWVMPLPEGLSLREVMIYGTAGLTAGAGVAALADRGVDPARGEIVVTGASGGVGSLAVAILAQAGYQVVASTGKAEQKDFLTTLGARSLISREDVVDASDKPLLPARWSGAIDSVGGATLSSIVRATEPRGCVVSCGLVGGDDLPLTVYPFILRGVDLVGVASASCPLEARSTVWRKLAGPWKPKMLDRIVSEEITLDQLSARVDDILAGKLIGRVLVRPGAR